MTIVPAVMRAIDPPAPAGPEVLQVAERPVPRRLRAKCWSASRPQASTAPTLCSGSAFIRRRPAPQPSPGLEIAGTVVAVGEGVSPNMIGTPVCALVAGGG